MPANIYDVVLPALLALFVSATLIGTLRRSRAAAAALDIPNHRSLHVAPVPRIGGLGILAGILAAGIAAQSPVARRARPATLVIGNALIYTSDSGADASRPASWRTAAVGNTMAPTSFMFRPVITPS